MSATIRFICNNTSICSDALAIVKKFLADDPFKNLYPIWKISDKRIYLSTFNPITLKKEIVYLSADELRNPSIIKPIKRSKIMREALNIKLEISHPLCLRVWIKEILDFYKSDSMFRLNFMKRRLNIPCELFNAMMKDFRRKLEANECIIRKL